MENVLRSIVAFLAGEARVILVIILFIGITYAWNRLSKSEKFHRWAVKINPKNAEAHLNLGYFLKGLPNHEEEAEKEFRQTIDLNPRLRRAYHGLFLIQEQSKKINEAEETIRLLSELFPDDPFAFVWKGGLLRDKKAFTEAEEYYSKAISLAPRYSFVYEHYGSFLLEQNRLTDAENVLITALNLGATSQSLYSNLVRVFSVQKKYVEAEKHARSFIKIHPNDPEAYLTRILVLGPSGKIDDALNVCRQVIDRYPNYGKAYFHLGVILHIETEQYDSAADAYRKAIDFEPDYAPSYYFLGRLLYEKFEQLDEAEELCRLAIQKNPDFLDAYQYLGFLLRNQPNKYLQAEEIYRKTISLNSKDVTAYNNLANLLHKTNRPDESMKVLQKVIELALDEFTWFIKIATLQKLLGERDKARQNAERSRTLIPKDDSYWYNLACIESICDNSNMAFECLEKAKEEKGFNTNWAWEDPDLQWIRDNPRFIEIVGPKPEK